MAIMTITLKIIAKNKADTKRINDELSYLFGLDNGVFPVYEWTEGKSTKEEIEWLREMFT